MEKETGRLKKKVQRCPMEHRCRWRRNLFAVYNREAQATEELLEEPLTRL